MALTANTEWRSVNGSYGEFAQKDLSKITRKNDRRRDFDKPLKMTEQHREFARQWAAGNSPRVAALRAGYSNPNMAWELQRNHSMIALYNEEKAKFEALSSHSRQRVLDMLQESYDLAKLMSEPMAMVAAAREVGKICGYYAPVEQKITIEGTVTVEKLNRLSNEELLKLMKEAGDDIIDGVTHVLEDGNDATQALEPPRPATGGA